MTADTPQLPVQWLEPNVLSPGLYIVSTPIGNTLDITLRALKVLSGVHRILCEDTRVTRKILSLYHIDKPLVSYHDHNESRRVPDVLDWLQAGEAVGLVADAGTPLIADPGYRLVRACHEAGFRVQAIPGACAITAALVMAGLPTHAFSFHGFLPPKSSARRKKLLDITGENVTVIFYEAPHRIRGALADIQALLGEREVCIARELTKHFEQIMTGSARHILETFPEDAECWRGEMVVLIAPAGEQKVEGGDLRELLQQALEKNTVKEAVGQVTALTGARRSEVYKLALEMQGKK